MNLNYVRQNAVCAALTRLTIAGTLNRTVIDQYTIHRFRAMQLTGVKKDSATNLALAFN